MCGQVYRTALLFRRKYRWINALKPRAHVCIGIAWKCPLQMEYQNKKKLGKTMHWNEFRCEIKMKKMTESSLQLIVKYVWLAYVPTEDMCLYYECHSNKYLMMIRVYGQTLLTFRTTTE